MKAVAELLPKDKPLAVYNEFRSQLAELRETNKKAVFDYETAKGAKEAKSHIYKLRQTKAAVDKARKDAGADALEYKRRVDSEAKEIVAELESMIDVHKKPLDEIEEREEQRVRLIRERIDFLGLTSERDHDGNLYGSDHHREVIEWLKDEKITKDQYQEFTEEAIAVRDKSLETLHKLLAEAIQREHQQAEVERLRKEAAEKERQDREERIRREAAEKAKAEAEDRARREAEALRQAELEAKVRAEKEAIALRLAAENAEREKIEAQERAERAAKEAEERTRREIAEKEAQQRAEDEKRAADVKHRKAINTDALADIVSAGLSEEDAKKVIMAIAKGKVRHITINY